LARIAVPFYFACAGYFLYCKLDTEHINWRLVRNYIFKILRLYAIWMTIVIFGPKYNLWFLPALAVAVVLLCLLLQYKFSISSLIILSLFFYGIGLLGDSYEGILEMLLNKNSLVFKGYLFFLHTSFKGIFWGMPFVMIGLVFAKYKIKISSVVAVIGFIVSMILMGAEAYFLVTNHLSRDYNTYVMLLPTIFFLMAFVLNYYYMGCTGNFYRLRVVGIIVYFVHLFVHAILKQLFKMTGGVDCVSSLMLFTLTLLMSVCLGIIVDRLASTTKYSFFKYLYS